MTAPDRPVAARDLAEWTTAEVAASRPILAVPVGSCEQHGPHLPLGTDTIVAAALAHRLAGAVGGVVVGPAVAVSASGEHAGFPGTLSIGTAATTEVLVELARSADWVEGIVLVNGHGGNAGAVAAAVATGRAEGRRILAWWPPAGSGDAHAGHTETSLLLALRPELVRTDLLAAGNTTPLAELAPLLAAGGVRAVSVTGVLGDPRGATMDDGHRLLDVLSADLIATTLAARADWAADPL